VSIPSIFLSLEIVLCCHFPSFTLRSVLDQTSNNPLKLVDVRVVVKRKFDFLHNLFQISTTKISHKNDDDDDDDETTGAVVIALIVW